MERIFFNGLSLFKWLFKEEKELVGYINGVAKKPKENDLTYHTWGA